MRRLQRYWNREKRFSSGGEIPRSSLMNMDLGGELILEVYSFRNQCRGFKKNWVNMGSLSFPSYLFFHTSDSGQIWYLLKAVIKEYPTLPRARQMKTNSWRTLEVIGTNLLA